MKIKIYISIIAIFMISIGISFAGNLTIPNSFSSGTPAVAQEVNDNFTEVANQVNDNDTRIANLETKSITVAGATFIDFGADGTKDVTDGSFSTFDAGGGIVGNGKFTVNINIPLNATITGFEAQFDDGLSIPSETVYANFRKMNTDVAATATLLTKLQTHPSAAEGIVVRFAALNDLNDDPLNFYYVEGVVTPETKVFYVRVYYML